MITKRAGWTSTGCYTDSVAARSLPYLAAVPGGSTANTVELCQTTCQAAGYKLAGVEYGAECCKFTSLFSSNKLLMFVQFVEMLYKMGAVQHQMVMLNAICLVPETQEKSAEARIV
jgi:hypothetical protein